MNYNIIPNGMVKTIKIKFKGLTWEEVKDNIEYMDKSISNYMNEMDVLYDVAFVKNDIVFSFVFQYEELESITVYKKGYEHD